MQHAPKTSHLLLLIDLLQCLAAGLESIAVLSKQGRLAPLRVGFWRDESSQCFRPDQQLMAVEPIGSHILELQRLAGCKGLKYAPSRNRQSHLFTFVDRPSAHSLPMKRVFLRSAVAPPPSPFPSWLDLVASYAHSLLGHLMRYADSSLLNPEQVQSAAASLDTPCSTGKANESASQICEGPPTLSRSCC